MRWKFGRRQTAEYTCCFCCHVRMGTMFLGIFYLLLDLLAVTMIATLTMYPDLVQQESDIIANYLGIESNSNSTLAPDNRTVWVIQNPLDCDSKLFGLFLTIGYSVFTLSLLYGVITGRPRYLLPFFCLQVFDFCATSFSFISYFSFEPDIKKWIASQKLLPLKDELLSISTDWLLILAALTAVTILWTKGYCIIIVWSCYKYLVHGEVSSAMQTVNLDGSSNSYEGHEQAESLSQIVLPPKYEDIVQIPILNPEPPPYVTIEAENSGAAHN
jgi:lysosomal-associated transmembrane protein